MAKPDTPANPFTGTLDVESCYVSGDGLLWTLHTKYEPGKVKWSYDVMDTFQKHNSKTVVYGKFYGYCNLGYDCDIRFLWEAVKKSLIPEHYLTSPHGCTGLFEEVFRMEIREHGKVAVILQDGQGFPVKWVLSKGGS